MSLLTIHHPANHFKNIITIDRNEMETAEELRQSAFHERRKNLLDSMNFRELAELTPYTDDELECLTKSDLIEDILENLWDNQINEEVR